MALKHEGLSPSQLTAISIIERTCSVFSLLGCLFIIVTFCCSRSFHKPVNRMVFYASFGNMLTNVGTLMSRTYIPSPDSVGCQFQAFLIQMFMPADAFWTLAMAINVYLTFYFKFDAERLRKMEPLYLLCCYGIPLVPAFTYIFVKNREGQRVYGDATLWCWVTPEWDIWRIATFYGPVWVVIVVTFFIYIRAGRTIYHKRRQLYDFSNSEPDPMSLSGEAVGTVKTTEVTVTTEVVDQPGSIQLQSVVRRGSDERDRSSLPNPAYSVTISAVQQPAPSYDGVTMQSQGRNTHQNTLSALPPRTPQAGRRRNYELNNAAWSYTKCSILFFTAILITWIPSSANRVFSVIHTRSSSQPLEFMSAFVLPLQGFWNAVIYIVTSWSACRNLLVDMRLGRRPDVTEIVSGMRPQESHVRHQPHLRQFGHTRANKTYETESMTELADSRGHSDDDEERRSS